MSAECKSKLSFKKKVHFTEITMMQTLMINHSVHRVII